MSQNAAKTELLATPMQNAGSIDFEIIELLFFAYRDFVSDPDQILVKSGFGRAHHRVVHFVNREPGMTVADLLETLQITKQSLARVLKQLIDSGYIRQVAGPEDRRQRKLIATVASALRDEQSFARHFRQDDGQEFGRDILCLGDVRELDLTLAPMIGKMLKGTYRVAGLLREHGALSDPLCR